MEEWHLDKRIPIGIIFTIIAQTVILGYWLGSLEQRVSSMESNRFTSVDGAVAMTRIDNNEKQIERLEARTLDALAEIKASLNSIERRLDTVYNPEE